MAATIFTLSAVALVLMLLRFVEPDIIYWFREVLVDVRKNLAFLHADVGRPFAGYQLLLIRDLRPEGVPREPREILSRVMKIRELYPLLDFRENEIPDFVEARNSNVCIVELANMLRSLAGNIQPSPDIAPMVMNAYEHLARLVEFRTGAKAVDEESVERHFTDKPVSIEEVSEILVAAVYALTYRLRMQNAEAGRDGGSTAGRRLLPRRL